MLESRVAPREGVRWSIGSPALRETGSIGLWRDQLCVVALTNLQLLGPLHFSWTLTSEIPI